MAIKIHKILKDDLSYDSGINISSAGMDRSTGMTISHFACSLKSTQATIPYEIESTEKRIPYIPPLEFSMVIRKKVDLTAIGVNEKIITQITNKPLYLLVAIILSPFRFKNCNSVLTTDVYKMAGYTSIGLGKTGKQSPIHIYPLGVFRSGP